MAQVCLFAAGAGGAEEARLQGAIGEAREIPFARYATIEFTD